MKDLIMKTFTCAVMLIASSATAAEEGGFLFATFKGEHSPMTEQVYFALSEDGRQWTALNGGEPVLVSTVGEKGVRDPYLLRAHDGSKYYLLATDLSINLNPDWGRAVRNGSQSIVIWESEDLVNWSEPRLVKVAADDAGCTWAPEATYDPESERYLVFWASMTGRDNYEKHRIWAAWTEDFKTFSEPFIYIEKPNHVIDTTIVRAADGKFYRFNKDEQFKAITMETSDSVTGEWQEVPDFSLAKLQGYEGPACYQVEPAKDGEPATWGLIIDHYARGQGYQPYVTQDLSSGQFEKAEGFSFPFRFRHGSVVPVTAEQYERLETAYGSGE